MRLIMMSAEKLKNTIAPILRMKGPTIVHGPLSGTTYKYEIVSSGARIKIPWSLTLPVEFYYQGRTYYFVQQEAIRRALQI